MHSLCPTYKPINKKPTSTTIASQRMIEDEVTSNKTSSRSCLRNPIGTMVGVSFEKYPRVNDTKIWETMSIKVDVLDQFYDPKTDICI